MGYNINLAVAFGAIAPAGRRQLKMTMCNFWTCTDSLFMGKYKLNKFWNINLNYKFCWLNDHGYNLNNINI